MRMKNAFRLLPVLAGSLVLTSCATLLAPEDEPSAYGAFLAARYAGVNRDAEGAATYYAEALNRAPGDATLADRAYITALLSGRMDEAAIYAEQSVAAGDPSRLASLYSAATEIRARRYSQGRLLLENAPDYGPFNDFIAQLMLHWALMGVGDEAEALEGARTMAAPGYLGPFIALHRAMLLEAAGRYTQADELYRSTVFATPFRRMAVEVYGGFLERRRELDAAETLYRTYLNGAPGEASILEALQRVEAGGRAPSRPTVSEFAALSLFGPAASLAAQADMDLTVIYLRMIQRLSPDYAPNRVLLGETLQRINFPEIALSEYTSIRSGPFYIPAQIDLIWLTARLDRLDQAAAMSQRLLDQTGDDEARLILADIYRVTDRCGDAIGLYEEVIARRNEAGELPDWRYHYFAASCHYLLDELDQAEAQYLTALEIDGNQAQVLNDLGYLWLDNGRHLDQAFDMVQQAAMLEPSQSHIIDSLGWAQYRLGNYEAAVRELERATTLDPGSATANYHLGDAYWRVGRELEARFQWRRTLDLEADPAEIEGARERLENGLPEAETITAENNAAEDLATETSNP